MQKPTANPLIATSIAVLLLGARVAAADPPEPAQASPPSQPVRSAAGGEWGWWILGSGILAGGVLTAYGLTFDCSDADIGCQKRASIAIWGGAGIAALASAVGLAFVEAGRRPVQVVPVVSADLAAPRVGAALRASF